MISEKKLKKQIETLDKKIKQLEKISRQEQNAEKISNKIRKHQEKTASVKELINNDFDTYRSQKINEFWESNLLDEDFIQSSVLSQTDGSWSLSYLTRGGRETVTFNKDLGPRKIVALIKDIHDHFLADKRTYDVHKTLNIIEFLEREPSFKKLNDRSFTYKGYKFYSNTLTTMTVGIPWQIDHDYFPHFELNKVIVTLSKEAIVEVVDKLEKMRAVIG